MRTKIVITRVAGVTFENRQSLIAQLHGNEPCRLEPEPTNLYDLNALKVIVDTESGPIHCGYVPRGLAKEIARHLEGGNLMVKFRRVTGGFETWYGDTANLGMIVEIEYPIDDEI